MKKFLAVFLALCLVPCLFACNKSSQSLNRYNIDVVYDGDRGISCNLTLDYNCNIPEGTDILKFNIFGNAFREGAKFTPVTGESFGDFRILSVTCSDAPCKYEICGKDNNVLSVNLAKKLGYNDKAQIKIAFEATLPEGNYRYAKGVDTVNLGNFYPVLCVYENGEFYECEYYPIGDPFYSEVSDYNVNITVPGSFVVGASGNASSCDVEGDKTMYSYSLKNSRDFAFCLSRNFEVKSKKWGDKTVNYCYLTDESPDATLEATISCLQYFSETFGEYPYESFTVCQSDFSEGGMEYPGLVYINKSLDTLNTLYTTVHETAHQWWYGVVGNNQLEESYLDEGLTEYSTCLFFDENEQYGIDASYQYLRAKKACMTHQKIIEGVKGEKPYMVKHLNAYNGELDYVNTAYNRGMTMFKGYEETYGKKKIKALLKKYYAKNKFQVADSEDLLSLSGKTRAYFESYLRGDAVI